MCVNGLVFYWECKILELSPGINPFPALIKSALVRYQCVCVCSRFQNKIIRKLLGGIVSTAHITSSNGMLA